MADLIQMCTFFPKESALGQEVHKLLNMLVDTNIRPRFVRADYKLNYFNFMELIPNPSLAQDLETGFIKQMIPDKEKLKKLGNRPVFEMPVSNFKAKAFPDEKYNIEQIKLS